MSIDLNPIDIIKRAAEENGSINDLRFKVAIESGGAGGGGGNTAALDDRDGFTEGTTSFIPVGAVYNDTLGADLTEDTAGVLRLTAKRALHVNLRNASAQEIGTASTPVRIDPTGSTAQPASQSGTWNLNNISGTISLPTGAATEATLSSIDTALSDVATETTLSTLNAKFVSGTDIGDVTINNGSGVSAVNIQDGGNSITVDGTVAATQSGTWNLNNISGTITLPTGAATESTLSTLNAKLVSGTDIGDVTINNAAGAAAVNIQDGGNSITVDGTVAATQSGTWNINNISGTVSLPTGAATESTLSTLNAKFVSGTDIGDVTINNASGASAVNIQDGGNVISVDDGGATLSVDDGGGSLTVDQGAGGSSPWRVTEYGTSNLPNLYWTIAGIFQIPTIVIGDPASGTVANVNASGGLEMSGDVAHDATDPATSNPIRLGGRAHSSEPTAVSAAGDRVNAYFDLNGYQHVKNHTTRTAITNLFSSQVLNATTSANSSTQTVTNYRSMRLYLSGSVSAGTPTSVQFIPQFSNDGGTTWFDHVEDHFSDLRFVRAQFPIAKSVTLKDIGRSFRLRIVGVGTDGSNTFTVSAWYEALT